MKENKMNLRDWSEQLEAGERDDELLSVAARLEKTRGEIPAMSVEFHRQLRRDLLNQYDTADKSSGRFWRFAGSLAGAGLLAVIVIATWLSVSSAGRVPFGDSPNVGIPRVSTPPVTAAVLTAFSENVPEGLTTGGTLDIHVRWMIPDALVGARPFAELRDDSGQTIAQADGQLHTSGEEQTADFLIVLPDTLPEGDYTVVVGLYDEDGARMPIYDSISSAVIYEYVIESATIGENGIANIDPVATALPPDGARYTLLGYSVRGGIVTETVQTDGGEEQTQSRLVPGMDIEVVTHWGLPLDPAEATAFVHLIRKDDGTMVAQSDQPIQTATTADGRRAKARLMLSVPADLAPGAYQLIGGLYDPASSTQLPFSITITAGEGIAGEVNRFFIGSYFVSAGGDSSLDPMDKALIELYGSEATVELWFENVQDAP